VLWVFRGFASFVAVKCSTHTMPPTDPTGNYDATNALLQQQEVRMEIEALSNELQEVREGKIKLGQELLQVKRRTRKAMADSVNLKAINEDLERKLLAQLG
ncbi:unnamed protein product, partial [Chrysoparadoxa australica]